MKQRTRLLISLIVALFLLAVAVPQLPIYGGDLAFGFSVLWLTFCILVIAANSYTLLRLGRGEVVQRPAMSKEQRQAIKRIQRYRARRQVSR